MQTKLTFNKLIIFILIINIGCVSSKKTESLNLEMSNLMKMKENASIRIIKDYNNKSKIKIPTCQEWIGYKNEAFKEFEDYKVGYRQKTKNYNTIYNWFTIGGATIGVVGGAYGLTNKPNTALVGIGSLVVGATSIMLKTMSVQKKYQMALDCQKSYEKLIGIFYAKWPNSKCPRTEKDLAKYHEDLAKTIQNLVSLECFGQTSSSLEIPTLNPE